MMENVWGTTPPVQGTSSGPVTGGVGQSEVALAPDAMTWASGGSGGGGVQYVTAGDLPSGPSSAPGWYLDPGSVDPEQLVQDVAQQLGVAGEVVHEYTTWTVRSADSTVSVYDDPARTVSYWDGSTDPWACTAPGGVDAAVPVAPREPAGPDTAVTSPGSDVAGGGVSGSAAPAPEPMPMPEPMVCDDVPAAPTGQGAVGQVEQVLSDLGVNTRDLEMEVSGDGGPVTYVTGHVLVGGERSGLMWSVGLSGRGVWSLTGPTAHVVELGEFDLVTPGEAVARLGDSRFGPGSGHTHPFTSDTVVSDAVAAEPGEAVSVEPAGPAQIRVPSGTSVVWPVRQVRIVDARLGTAPFTFVGYATVVLPVYELTDDNGAVWPVLAVTEGHLDTAG